MRKQKPLKEKVTYRTAVGSRILERVYPEEDVAEAVAELNKFVNGCYACPDKCDGCLADIENKIDKIFGTFNHSPQEAPLVGNGNATEDTSNSKGCGKIYSIHVKPNNRETKVCGKYWLCPKCQEKEDVCANCGVMKFEHDLIMNGCEKFKPKCQEKEMKNE